MTKQSTNQEQANDTQGLIESKRLIFLKDFSISHEDQAKALLFLPTPARIQVLKWGIMGGYKEFFDAEGNFLNPNS